MSEKELNALISSTLVDIDVSSIKVTDTDWDDPILQAELRAMESDQLLENEKMDFEIENATHEVEGSGNDQVEDFGGNEGKGRVESQGGFDRNIRLDTSGNGPETVESLGSDHSRDLVDEVSEGVMQVDQMEVDEYDLGDDEDVGILIAQRQGEYTAVAKYYKLVDRDKCLRMIQVLKALKVMKEKYESGDVIDASSIPPSPPPIEDYEPEIPDPNIVVSSPQKQVQPIQTSSWRDDQFDSIIRVLEHGTKRHHEAAVRNKLMNKREKALGHLRIKKELNSNMEQVIFCKSIPTIPPPLFHYEEFSHQEEVINDDLGPYDFLFVIESCKHLLVPDNISRISLYIVVEFPYPDSKNPQKFTTSTVYIDGPQYGATLDMTKIFKVDKKKSFARFISSRKITISLFHKRGFFFSDTPLGTAEVRMSDLTESVESIEVAEVMNGRQGTGGTLHIKMGLREPAGDKQLKVWNEKRLVIDRHFTLEDVANDPSLQNLNFPVQTQTTPPTTPTQHVKSPSPRIEQQPAPKPTHSEPIHNTPTRNDPPREITQITPKPEQQVTQTQNQDTEDLPDTTSLNWIVSNAVMENEMEKLEAIINAKKSQGKDYTTETIQLRMLESKVDVLIYQIQSGVVTMDLYTEIITKKIQEERLTAKKYIDAGDKETAVACLQRAKIMKQEIGL